MGRKFYFRRRQGMGPIYTISMAKTQERIISKLSIRINIYYNKSCNRRQTCTPIFKSTQQQHFVMAILNDLPIEFFWKIVEEGLKLSFNVGTGQREGVISERLNRYSWILMHKFGFQFFTLSK